MDDREWLLELGTGERAVLVLPRMDYEGLSAEEWTAVLRPFLSKYQFIILDYPEKLVQEQQLGAGFTVKELAEAIHRYIGERGLRLSMVWGFSLGGMIAQELAVLDGMQHIPLVLVSTNACADTQLAAVFSTWALALEAYGPKGLERSMQPWIVRRTELPLMDRQMAGAQPLLPPKPGDGHLGMAKMRASLQAVCGHNAVNVLPAIQTPALLLFGKESVLLNESHARMLSYGLRNAREAFIAGAGMRIFQDNHEETVRRIQDFMEAVI